MGTIYVGDVIARVATTLYDTNNANWSQAELLGYLNDGQRRIGTIQPTGTQTIAVTALVAGARQTLPATGWMLIDVLRNMGSNGTTPGKAIRVISRRILEGFDPNWMTMTPTSVVTGYIYDLRDQASFFVYPPSTGGVYVEINYAASPVPLTAMTQQITVFDVMEDALYNYMLYRACSKIAPYSPGPKIAEAFYAMFLDALKQRQKAEDDVNPNTALEQAVPGTAIEGES